MTAVIATLIAAPIGLAFSDALSASLAPLTPISEPPVSFISAITLGSPPIFVNAIDTAKDVNEPVSAATMPKFSENTSHMPLSNPAMSVATGANMPPATSARSPQAFAHCFSLPVAVCASARACANPDADNFCTTASFSDSVLHFASAGMYSCKAVVLPCTAAEAALTAVMTSIFRADASPIADRMTPCIWSDETPIDDAIACIASTCSSPYVVMRWISEANSRMMGTTSDTFPPFARIAAVSFCTAISCRPNASMLPSNAAGNCVANRAPIAPSSRKKPSNI